jgi:hypothetical protein
MLLFLLYFAVGVLTAAGAPSANTTFVSQLDRDLAHDTRQLGWAMQAAYEGLTFFDKCAPSPAPATLR